MALLKKIPHTYTILASIIVLCAVLSWIVPAGEYERQTLDVNGVRRTVIVGDSFHRTEASPQTWQVFASLLDGFEMQAGVIAFLLIIGGAFQILNDSKAIDVGILSFLGSARRWERYGFVRKLGVRKSYHFFILVILAFTIVFLVTGVMGYGWYLREISALFLAMGILPGF